MPSIVISLCCRFLAIPFLLELRVLMDWIWTDSTLAIGSWLQMEDIYANIYVLKCWREAERVTSLISLIFCLCVEMCIPPVDIIKTSIVCMHQFNSFVQFHYFLYYLTVCIVILNILNHSNNNQTFFDFIIKTRNINGCFTASYPL